MGNRRALILAALFSLLLHLGVLFSYDIGFQSNEPEPAGEPLRLSARLSQGSSALPKSPPEFTPLPKRRPPQAHSASRAQTSPAEPIGLLSESEFEQAKANVSVPIAQDELSSASSADMSHPASEEAQENFDADRIPEQGRVLFSGTAGGFVALQAQGIASWSHDGEFFESRLAAGLASVDGSFDYRANGRFTDHQLLIENTLDVRRDKISSAAIDHTAGKVFMSRGKDRRERSIKGLAVALAALPQFLMALDEKIEKAAIFIVGDFWVEDSVLIDRGIETLGLPLGELRARHYQSRIPNGKLVDIWLAADWQNAPIRIRIEADGWVVDLKAREVELNGTILGKAPDAESE